MEKVLLLSTAYSWYIGLLVLMIVMAILFIAIALFALKPYKLGEAESGAATALKLLENREAELTSLLLHHQDDAVILEQLREVAIAKILVQELLARENGEDTPEAKKLGVDDTLTEEEVASLESEESVSLEQTFNMAPDDSGLDKSFSAKLIQAKDEVKVWYFELKNCILCYQKTKTRMHWNNEKFYIGKNNVATITIRGKQLCLYLALNADDYSYKYPVKNSTSEMYKRSTPCLFRIKSDKGLKQAKELIGLLMADYGSMYVRTNHSIYALPYEDDGSLIAKGLVKEVEKKEQVSEQVSEQVNEQIDGNN